jgi:hypothetical protein
LAHSTPSHRQPIIEHRAACVETTCVTRIHTRRGTTSTCKHTWQGRRRRTHSHSSRAASARPHDGTRTHICQGGIHSQDGGHVVAAHAEGVCVGGPCHAPEHGRAEQGHHHVAQQHGRRVGWLAPVGVWYVGWMTWVCACCVSMSCVCALTSAPPRSVPAASGSVWRCWWRSARAGRSVCVCVCVCVCALS